MKSVKKVREKEKNKNSRIEELKIKSQAAMEYLMTYGWAILIIALSLVVLYSLGIMNPKNFIPRAPPGSCFVFRPNGPGTTDFISLQGTCGYLPMYVASFDGVSGYVGVPYSVSITSPAQNNRLTWSTWTMGLGSWSSSYEIFFAQSGRDYISVFNSIFLISLNLNNTQTAFSTGFSPTIGKWYHVAVTWDGSYVRFYVNGALKYVSGDLTGKFLSWDTSYYFRVGIPFTGYPFKGTIANAQIYNTALTQQEIQYLYQQGLGGGPVRLQNLVLWLPLNGDAKDYSGNNNHGTIYGGVTFVQNYNPP
jgi:hypothetical protein